MPDKRLTMQDPRSQYPQPPFKPQHQPQPGLEKNMDPKPDAGETSYTGSGRLQGRKALVTGADSGIGRAVAIGYLPSEEPDAKEVMSLIEQAGVKAVALPGDISDESFAKSMVQQAHQQLGGLDILVNNAGFMMSHESLTDVASADLDRLMKTNIYALVWMTQAAMKILPPGASIINTASVQAVHPSPGIVDYAMTKAAIVAFTKGMAKPLMEQGIRINAVAPGPFWTPIQPAGQPPEKLAKLGETVPFKRPGQPVEIAPVYVLLASQEASYTTGEVYGVTGGMGVV
jgi:NAD(P)-dependent dehydrogenase (short-subunit alcohol dehydrogenase family)